MAHTTVHSGSARNVEFLILVSQRHYNSIFVHEQANILNKPTYIRIVEQHFAGTGSIPDASNQEAIVQQVR